MDLLTQDTMEFYLINYQNIPNRIQEMGQQIRNLEGQLWVLKSKESIEQTKKTIATIQRQLENNNKMYCLLTEVLEELSPLEREVFNCYYLHGLSSNQTGMETFTCKSTVIRIRKRICKKLYEKVKNETV